MADAPDPDSTVVLRGPGDAEVSGAARTVLADGGAALPAEPQVFGDEGRYRPGAEIGRGGLGRVVEAVDHRLERPVAIKQLQHRGGEARFVREALITARLEHPAIVPVHDRGVRDGRPYYVMKRVAGRPLSELVRAATTPAARLALLEHVIAVCDAVGFAHERQIIHRDLKPHNVMVGTHGETVVIDWGLAKELGTDDLLEALPASGGGSGATPGRSAGSALTAEGMVMGTPGYMAPEQARGAEVDARADVYAVGAMLVHVLGGRGPDDDPATALAHLAPELTAIVRKAMAAEPAERYPDARALGADLRRFTTGRLVTAHHYSAWQRVRRFAQRHRAIVTVTAAAVLAIAAVTALAFSRVVAARDRMALARDQMREARNGEAARVIELRWRQAVGDLDRAPARSLGWLRALDRAGGFDDWRGARVVAADAISRGVPQVLARVGELAYELAPLADGSILFATGGGAIVRADGRGGYAEIARYPDSATVAASPDGSYAVAGGGAGALRVLEGGRVVREVPGFGEIAELAATPERFAVGAADGLYVFGRDGARQRMVPAAGIVLQIERLADGWLWTAADRAVRITGDDGVTRTLWRGDDDVHAVAASPDRRAVAIVNDPGPGVIVVDRATGAARTLAGPTVPRTGVAWSPDGQRIAAVGPHAVLEVWELATGQRAVYPLPAGQLMMTRDGERLFLNGHDGVVRVAGFAGVVLAELRGHTDTVYGTLAQPGDHLISIGSDGALLRWDLAAVLGRRLAVPATRPRALAVAGGVAVVAARDGLHAIGLADGAARRLSRGDELVVATIDATTLVSGTWDGVVTRWDLATGAATARVELGGGDPYVQAIAVAPDRQRLVVLTYDSRVQLRRVADLGLIAETKVVVAGGTVDFDAAFAPDGQALYVGNNDGTVRVHDAASLAVRRTFKLPMRVARLSVSPDGRQLAIAGNLSRIGLVGVDGAGYRELRGHKDAVNTVAFAPDGAALLSASDDGDSRIWDLASGLSRPIARGTAVVAAGWLDGDVIDLADDGALRVAADRLPRGEALRAWLRAQADAVDP